MDVCSKPSKDGSDDSKDNDRPHVSGGAGGGSDPSDIDPSDDSDASTSGDEDDSKISLPLRRRYRARLRELKTLRRSLTARTAYVTRLRNERQLASQRWSQRIAANKSQISILQNTLRQERTSRTQMRLAVRGEFTAKIKNSQILERAANKRANQAEKELEKTRKKSEETESQHRATTLILSQTRASLARVNRANTDLARKVKNAESALAKCKEKCDSVEEAKLSKRLEIERTKTERAQLEAAVKSRGSQKRLNEIAAQHSSKMAIISEQSRLKEREKRDREAAKLEAAKKKQKSELENLETAKKLFHDSGIGGSPFRPFPGNNALVQMLQAQHMAALAAQLGGQISTSSAPVSTLEQLGRTGVHTADDTRSESAEPVVTPSPQKKSLKNPPPPPIKYRDQTLTQMAHLAPLEEERNETERSIPGEDDRPVPQGVEVIEEPGGARVYRRLIDGEYVWYVNRAQLDEALKEEGVNNDTKMPAKENPKQTNGSVDLSMSEEDSNGGVAENAPPFASARSNVVRIEDDTRLFTQPEETRAPPRSTSEFSPLDQESYSPSRLRQSTLPFWMERRGHPPSEWVNNRISNNNGRWPDEIVDITVGNAANDDFMPGNSRNKNQENGCNDKE